MICLKGFLTSWHIVMTCELQLSEQSISGIERMNCVLMFIVSNNNGRKFLSYLLHLEPCNNMFKVISDIKQHSCNIWNSIINAINFYKAKKMNRGLMCIMSNHGRKCLSNLLQLEPRNDMFKSDFWHGTWLWYVK